MTVTNNLPTLRRPNALERCFNRLFGVLAARGIGLAHNYRLEINGPADGQQLRTPVNLLVIDDRHYLVAPRGETLWVRRLRRGGQLLLRRGREARTWRAHELDDAARPPILKIYLERYAPTVQRYFDVDATAPVTAFAAVAARHPVFELEPN